MVQAAVKRKKRKEAPPKEGKTSGGGGTLETEKEEELLGVRKKMKTDFKKNRDRKGWGVFENPTNKKAHDCRTDLKKKYHQS